MNTYLAAGMIALFVQVPGAQLPTAQLPGPQDTTVDSNAEKPIRLNFSQADVSQVFRVIGMRTGVNIVYSGSDKLPVTIKFDAPNADQAIRATVAAAGLAYRKVGKIYVVAKAESIRQTIAPFALRTRIRTPDATPEMAAAIQAMVPDATVTAGKGEIIVLGIPEDVRQAEDLINLKIVEKANMVAPEVRNAQIVGLGVAPPKGIIALLAELFPDVKASVISEGTNGGGSIALLGKASDIAAAKAKALELDGATPSVTGIEVTAYEVRYASARMLADFLHEAAPDVQVTIAPPNHVPERLTGGTTVTQSGSTAAGGASGGAAAGGSGGAAGGGAAGGSGAPATGGPGVLSAQYDRATRIVLRGRTGDVDTALKLLKSVDVEPLQVVVEVRIVDASPEDIAHTGINYAWQPFQFFDLPKSATTSVQTAPPTRPVGLGQISRLPINFTATLDAMVSHSDAKLLASPSMQVLNNEEANFFIGDQLSFPVTTSGTLGSQNTVIQTYNIGIGLNVRPRVNSDGNITLRLNPVVQNLTSIQNGLPQTSSREATTVVMVRDGESVVIGGLIRDNDTKTVQEIPILGRLPLVGQLFRHTDRDHLKSNIIVAVTPHIVKRSPEAQK